MKPTRILPLLVLVLVATGPAFAGSKNPLPAEFRQARIFVLPQTVDGEILTFYTDTGGGFNAISRQAAERAGLEPERVTAAESERFVVDFPGFRESRDIPAGYAFMDGRLAVVDESKLGGDGFLGGRWFADKVWEFDYLSETLSLFQDWHPPANPTHSIRLGFQVNANGERTTHFARMSVTIDGETLPVLLDTGATATVTEDSASYFEAAPGTDVGTSFIVKTVFDKWVKRHPDWLVVNAGELHKGHRFPMIRVPKVTIAGHTVGPVWFTRRPDRSFHDYMSQWMDKPVDGAIGGSAFKYFRMIVDYPNARAYFFKK